MFDFLKQVKRKVFNVNTDSPNSYGSRQAKPRIVGGEKAKLGQFPFQVIFYHGPIKYNIINHKPGSSCIIIYVNAPSKKIGLEQFKFFGRFWYFVMTEISAEGH